MTRAIDALEQINPSIRALYCSRTRPMVEAGNETCFPPLFRKMPDFRNALVQSAADENSVMFNRKARELLAFCRANRDAPSHDWWLYPVISARGGKVRFDVYPSLRDRHHSDNIMGSNIGWGVRAPRAESGFHQLRSTRCLG